MEEGWSAVEVAPLSPAIACWSRQTAAGSEYLVRYTTEQTAEFKVSADGRRIGVAWTNPEVDLDRLLGAALEPMLALSQRLVGRLCFHAGAVGLAERAIAIVGRSGGGKSTTVASLTQRAWRLLSDDLVLIDERERHPVVWPGGANVKMSWESLAALNISHQGLDAHSAIDAKFRMTPAASSDQPHDLAGIFVLGARGPGNAVSLRQLTAREALPTLLQQIYPPFLPVQPHENIALARNLALLMARTPVYHVERPEDLRRLPELCDLIQSTITYPI